jgi:hypothetical protein
MWSDSLVTSTEAIGMLRLHHEHFKTLVEIGIIPPVAWGADGTPRFSKTKVLSFREPEEAERLQDVLAENFEPRGRSIDPSGNAWAPRPHYPFDNFEQEVWARRRHRLGGRYSRAKDSDREIEAAVRRIAAEAAKAFSKNLHFDADARVQGAAKVSREELHKLVWSKPMDALAIDLGMTETPLRQLCNDCCIPTPGRGHFKLQDPIDRPPMTPLPMFPKRRP